MYTRAVQGIVMTMRISGPSTNYMPKFAMKLPATVVPRWEGVVSHGEASYLL